MPPATSAESGVRLPTGLSSLSTAAAIPALDPTGQAYFGPDRIVAATGTFQNTDSFKTYEVPGGLMVSPLRPMPAEPSVFTPPVGANLEPGATPTLFRQTLVFGLPCWVWRSRPACRDHFLLAPPMLALDRPYRFGNDCDGDRFLLNGWSGPSPGGHWSEGPEAAFAFSLPPDLPSGARPVLLLQAHAFMAGDSKPVRVRFRIDGQKIASATFTIDHVQAIPLPTGARRMILRLVFPNPRRPSALSDSTDSRLLALYIEQITLVASDPLADNPKR